MNRSVCNRLSLLLATVLLLCGCTGESIPTQPTDGTTTGPVATSSPVPAETQDFNPEWSGCEVITPEEGVLILNGNESLQDAIIEGDVYITANAEVVFDHVYIRGKVYVHGKLTLNGRIGSNGMYAYKEETFSGVCSAYDGIHGEIILNKAQKSGGTYIAVDALDYAFETWGKVEPTEQPPTQMLSEDAGPSHYDPAQVTILSGKQTVAAKAFNGDVYIPADGDITFCAVSIDGNIYVAGKLHISDFGVAMSQDFKTKIYGSIYAYDFGVTCEAFDGTHGQVTGGPVWCGRGYVVANDALDYAFETWGKQ